MDGLYVVATFSISILFMSILWYIKTSLERRKNPPLPPGPLGLPIFGYLPFLGNNLFEKFIELGHKYGPIISISLGNKLCVVINSPSLVKEVVRDQDSVFANRDIPAVGIVATYGANDIVFSELNSKWRAMRKIFVQEMMNTKSLDASYNLRKDQGGTYIGDLHFDFYIFFLNKFEGGGASVVMVKERQVWSEVEREEEGRVSLQMTNPH
ncbi:PREDICTED: cytochrome P450 71D7-like [Erythranthe guttata]|uniref:cytochrome P450 71D7-like n=1 Tax=Erythranthe guttata TaxID=4155 RepID=UPI00064DF7BA|nr:PREDICTED: cytochrome P450 71D7-like [Erythranthe guttata]|eukprot:XP_012856962.1 PREDICTED: cytochrome P450 71D7-like [Erythranthe guttata]